MSRAILHACLLPFRLPNIPLSPKPIPCAYKQLDAEAYCADCIALRLQIADPLL